MLDFYLKGKMEKVLTFTEGLPDLGAVLGFSSMLILLLCSLFLLLLTGEGN